MLARSACATAVALAAVAIVAGACTSAPGRPTAAASMLPDCSGKPQARPDVVVLMCATAGITAHGLRWSAWGTPVATGVGTAIVDTCVYEDCAAGLYKSYPVVVVVSRLSGCPGHARAYTRIQYMFVGAPPFPRTLVAADDPLLTRSCA